MKNNSEGSAPVRISSVHACQNGKIAVGVTLRDGENSEKREFHLIDELYMQLGIRVGPSDADTVATLERADALSSAVTDGMNSLAYGDCTCRGLAVKLIRKGHKKETAENAVRFLRSKGYIDEIPAVERAVARYAEQLKKVRAALARYGYSLSEINSAMRELRY